MNQVLSPPSSQARNAVRERRLTDLKAVLIAAVAVGIALRIAAALGPLGLDEAWSLRLAGSLPSIGDAFWGLPHDNNHALNTAMMVALGPDRPAWVYRTPALVFGALTILAVGRSLARNSVVAAAVGATLAAVTLPLVDFGSEARGYAGLALASVLAIGQWQRAMAAPPRGARSGVGTAGRWGLAAAVGFGAVNHLAMAMTVAVLGAATLLLAGVRTRRVGSTLKATARVFAPTAVALLPVALALAVAIRRGGGFRIGDVDPFTPAKLAEGMGDMVALTLGLPASSLSPLFAALVLACLAAALRRGLLQPAMAALCASAFVALPAALWVAQVANVGYARYFAICAIVLVLALSDIAGRLWTLGGKGKAWVAVGLSVVLVASLSSDFGAIRQGRSPGPQTLAIMQASQSSAYGTSHPEMAGLLLGMASSPTTAPAGACAVRPEWYIAVGVFDSRPSGTITLGSGDCAQAYRMRAPFGSNPLSGTQWTLYRRVPTAPRSAVTVWPGRGT